MKRPTLPYLFAVVASAAAATGFAAQSADLAAEGRAWWAHIQYLADDKLEGRNVGTPGFEAAAKYVEGQFQAIGLKPAGTSGFRQPVKLEARSLVPEASKLALVRDGRETPLAIGQDATLSARAELDGSMDASMVFVGYGMSIVEAGWDDFAGLDLKGKVAVYVNAFPPVTVSDNVKSHVNTADERWLALKRAGAIGVATIAAPRAGGPGRAAGANAGAPEGRGAAAQGRPAGAAPSGAPAQAGGGRGGGPPQPTIALADRDLVGAAGEQVAIALTPRGAAAVLAGTGHTLDEINQLLADNKPLPRFAIPGTLRAQAHLTRDPVESANIVGMVEGSDPALKSEYVIMSAHLDHLGVGRAVNGDAIYNGAMDDASGVASVIETARLLKASGVKTKRSVIFVAVTAEEKGELGSQYFAAHPTVPFDRIIADINLDMFLPLYPLKVIEVQGLTESSLGDAVRAAARSLGVDVQTDREPEQNRFIRSDQYSFIKRGVPALAFKFGYEFGSPEETIRRTWVRDIYHKPADDLNQPVDKDAAALFDRVIMTLLQSVANDPKRPTWNADSFFRRFATGR
ncbi:MAG TPA: M20/M25/M40 family metallo-hydrolase [Vicinamibacterales bacterium]|nr:M20/M25/M40 family metallo-hydrolase [Vicinamibacterales bacterium]